MFASKVWLNTKSELILVELRSESKLHIRGLIQLWTLFLIMLHKTRNILPLLTLVPKSETSKKLTGETTTEFHFYTRLSKQG